MIEQELCFEEEQATRKETSAFEVLSAILGGQSDVV